MHVSELMKISISKAKIKQKEIQWMYRVKSFAFANKIFLISDNLSLWKYIVLTHLKKLHALSHCHASTWHGLCETRQWQWQSVNCQSCQTFYRWWDCKLIHDNHCDTFPPNSVGGGRVDCLYSVFESWIVYMLIYHQFPQEDINHSCVTWLTEESRLCAYPMHRVMCILHWVWTL